MKFVCLIDSDANLCYSFCKALFLKLSESKLRRDDIKAQVFNNSVGGSAKLFDSLNVDIHL